ncbi:MAG: hypothetical protein DYG94_14295 [Leptolyngbya sp. PLA3]|nr:MAG: hypothetical protein EDM82_13305 [Cyanobacteria bacterium CYA]MCE7969898.1 hypothetical protein [Leptolyngbya sp. PL-A3]
MAYFSLGGAYNQNAQFDKAAAAYIRCTELNPSMSKAYQLAGTALMAAQDVERAKEVLTEGYTVAAARGDLMPQKGIAELLQKLGAPVPEAKKPESQAPVGGFICRKTGRPGRKMVRPPYNTPVGRWIQENIAQETFYDGWLPTGTKIINELRLDLARDPDAAAYDHAMRAYLGIDTKTYRDLTGCDPKPIDPQSRDMIERMFGNPDDIAAYKGGLREIVERGE